MNVHERDDAYLPSVSVVIPAFREPERLRSCLQGLVAQDYPSERLEIVVVDDGSPTPLAPVADELAGGPRILVHRQDNAGPATARNAGARLAGGDVLAFTDDDCVPDPGWVRALVAALAREPEAIVGGIVVNALRHDRLAETSQQLVAFLYEWYGDGREGRFLTSNNMALSRRRFLKAGGFDESFTRPAGEDRELCERWQRDLRPLVVAPEAIVRHAHAMTLRRFLRQHLNYGRGAFQLQRRRARANGTGLRFEPLRFYARLVAHPFGRLPLADALPQSALLLVTQAANAAGFMAEWVRPAGAVARVRGDRAS